MNRRPYTNTQYSTFKKYMCMGQHTYTTKRLNKADTSRNSNKSFKHQKQKIVAPPPLEI